MDLLLELHPEFLVELAELWAHVRVVEGLSIGLGAEEAVRGGYHVTTVVSAPTEEVLRRESLRYVGIPLPSIATSDGLSRSRIVEGEADEAWVTLVGVVLE